MKKGLDEERKRERKFIDFLQQRHSSNFLLLPKVSVRRFTPNLARLILFTFDAHDDDADND